MDSCNIEGPGSIATGAVCLIPYCDRAAPHRFCSVRNCLFRGAAGELPNVPANVYGIAPGPALGFVAEGNYPVQRLIVHDNVIEPTAGGIAITNSLPADRLSRAHHIVITYREIDQLLLG